MVVTQHGLHYSVIEHLRIKFGVPVEWVRDGYKKPDAKPFITVEQMQNNYEILAKQREAVETIYRFQVGLHAGNSTQRAQMQELIQQTFIFDRFTYLDTANFPATARGFFMCELTAVVPMPAGDVNHASDYHRVYFDIEIENEKYREAL